MQTDRRTDTTDLTAVSRNLRIRNVTCGHNDILLTHRALLLTDVIPSPPPSVALRPNAGHGLLILEISRSHSDTSQSVGLLWTSDQLVAETST